jgi:SAM-dependent methyltransferase
MTQRAEHWDGVYRSASPSSLSWHEREPTYSLQQIEASAADLSAAVLDVGAGTSALVDRLLERGFSDVTVLDISEQALAEARRRLGQQAGRATFVRHDLLTWHPDRQYDIWHDRAVFHFLVDDADRDRYVELAGEIIRTGGWLVLATFAPDGPTRCSGLPVRRYSPDDLADTYSKAFTLVNSEREEHVTPGGVIQPVTWVRLRRTRTLP